MSAEAHVRRSAFWPAFWLALPLLGAKLAHWSPPGASWVEWRDWLRDVIASAHADLAFAAGFGLACALLLGSLRRFPRAQRAAWLAVLASGTACAVYAVASVQIFAFLRSPLTYPLLYLAGDMNSMRSSIGSFVSPGVAAGLVLVPLGYLLAVRWTGRPAGQRLGGRLALPALALALLWAGAGHRLATGRWSDRADHLIARNPHWTLVASLVNEARGAGVPTLDERFPDEFLADFEPRLRAAQPQAVAGPPGPHVRPRNVLLVVLESTGARYLSLYGSPYATTPRLEAEARHALVYDAFYAHVGLTANSLAALSLSIYPYMTWREYTQDYPTYPGETVAGVLAARGYRTAFLTSGYLDYVNQEAFLTGRGFGQLLDGKDFGGEQVNSWGVSDALLVDNTLEWIDREPGRPFYAVAWTQASHHPYDPQPGQATTDFFAGRPAPEDAWDLGRYLDTLAEVDRQLGRLFDGLRQRGLDDDTIVIVTGDHGESFGDPHATWGHGFRLWDTGLRVPLMVWSPALFPEGRRVETVGGHVDLSPTILDLLGEPAPAQWQGTSLLARQRPPRAYFYAANDDYLLGVREGRFKYVYNVTMGRDELYDLQADPREQVNLAARQPQRCAELRQRLAAWKHSAAERLRQAREAGPAPAQAVQARLDQPRS